MGLGTVALNQGYAGQYAPLPEQTSTYVQDVCREIWKIVDFVFCLVPFVAASYGTHYFVKLTLESPAISAVQYLLAAGVCYIFYLFLVLPLVMALSAPRSTHVINAEVCVFAYTVGAFVPLLPLVGL